MDLGSAAGSESLVFIALNISNGDRALTAGHLSLKPKRERAATQDLAAREPGGRVGPKGTSGLSQGNYFFYFIDLKK
jgi:hypothetical protein